MLELSSNVTFYNTVGLYCFLFIHRYLYVRLDGTMSIKKRAKIVERFNSPSVSVLSLFNWVTCEALTKFDVFLTESRVYIHAQQ